jgi:hypothetical protein
VNLKIHLSGDAIVYDSKKTGSQRKIFSTPTNEGRPQGSLYNQNKRKISDACEYLRLSLQNNNERCALIFTLTTPTVNCRLADQPKFVSSWFENMRKNYELGEYVWTREYTKKGSTHFHCIGDWFHPSRFFAVDIHSRIDLITTVSLAWSRYFESDSVSSIWLGGYWYGKRIYSLRTQAQSRYLTKYFGKTFGEKKRVIPAIIPRGSVIPRPVNLSSQNNFQSVLS